MLLYSHSGYFLAPAPHPAWHCEVILDTGMWESRGTCSPMPRPPLPQARGSLQEALLAAPLLSEAPARTSLLQGPHQSCARWSPSPRQPSVCPPGKENALSLRRTGSAPRPSDGEIFNLSEPRCHWSPAKGPTPGLSQGQAPLPNVSTALQGSQLQGGQNGQTLLTKRHPYTVELSSEPAQKDLGNVEEM